MITISLMGQLQTADGERDLACDVPSPMSVRQVIQRQGIQLRHLLQLIREKKVLVTVNKKIASEDSLVQNGDAIRLVGHDGMGGTGLGPSCSEATKVQGRRPSRGAGPVVLHRRVMRPEEGVSRTIYAKWSLLTSSRGSRPWQLWRRGT
jgi:hypothetical protein